MDVTGKNDMGPELYSDLVLVCKRVSCLKYFKIVNLLALPIHQKTPSASIGNQNHSLFTLWQSQLQSLFQS